MRAPGPVGGVGGKQEQVAGDPAQADRALQMHPRLKQLLEQHGDAISVVLSGQPGAPPPPAVGLVRCPAASRPAACAL